MLIVRPTYGRRRAQRNKRYICLILMWHPILLPELLAHSLPHCGTDGLRVLASVYEPFIHNLERIISVLEATDEEGGISR